jgi:hypothetical protein
VRLAGYAVILAALIVLVWPSSAAGQAVQNVAGQLAQTLRGGNQ